MARAAPGLEACLEELERSGLLLLQDARLPCVATIVAGERVRGSWWGHPRGAEIFNAAEALEAHGDVAVAKLVSGKVTYIHRPLWGALYSVGAAREAWQMKGLSKRAQALLRAVDKVGALRTDVAASLSRVPPRQLAAAALELERRLLVASEEVHTETGAHAKELKSWARWADGVGLAGPPDVPAVGRRAFEGALRALNAEAGASATLPWPGRPGTSR